MSREELLELQKGPAPQQKETEALKEEAEEESPAGDLHFDTMNYPADTTLKGYREMWDNGQLEIPDFQREYVWKQTQASKLIESFLLGMTVPSVFLYRKRDSEKDLVIDGQQRISTVVSFLKGKFLKGKFKDKIFKLTKVDPKWEGQSFEDLAKADQFKLERTIMRATIIQQLDPKDNSSIYQIFERLNTGGANLSPMEVRMCLSKGSFVKMLKDLNKNPNWRKLLGNEKEDPRSKDKELILRVMALYDKGEEYTSPLKRFLNDYLRENKKADNKEITKKTGLFLKAVGKANTIKEKPFHLDSSRGLNFSIMDSILIALMKSPVESTAEIRSSYENLINNETYIKLIKRGQTSKPETVERLTIAEQAFKGQSHSL